MPTDPMTDAPLAEEAPTAETLQDYDFLHLITYLRLLDAAAEDADWREVARIVLNVDPAAEPGRAWRIYETHLRRARWLADHGHAGLLDAARPH